MMNNNVKMRYEVCEKCLSEHCHTKIMRDELLGGIVRCSLKNIGLVLLDKENIEWKNYAAIVSRESGWIKGFADNTEELCRNCNYKMEHTIFGG